MQFLFQFFYLVEKLQAKLEHLTFHQGLFGVFLESISNIKTLQIYCRSGLALVVLAHSQPSAHK